MTLEDSVRANCHAFYEDLEDFDDAMNSVEDVVVDVLGEHPNADEQEVKQLIIAEFKELFDEDSD